MNKTQNHVHFIDLIRYTNKKENEMSSFKIKWGLHLYFTALCVKVTTLRIDRPKLKKYFVCPLPTLHFWVGSVGRKNVLFFSSIISQKVDPAKQLVCTCM